MNKQQKRVLKCKVKPNCFVLVSGQQRDLKETFGEVLAKSVVSLLYDAGDVAAEWEVEYGPIQIWNRCDMKHPEAKEHYFYDYIKEKSLNWSQLAVSDNHLPESFIRGDFDYIFSVLKRWAEREDQ